MSTTARVSVEPLTTLDKRATFNDLRNCKAKSINVRVAGKSELLKLTTNDKGTTWRGDYADTQILIKIHDRDASIVFTSGGPKTRHVATVATRDAISSDMSYLLAGYGAPISFVAAKRELHVAARAAHEDQFVSHRARFDDLFESSARHFTLDCDAFKLACRRVDEDTIIGTIKASELARSKLDSHNMVEFRIERKDKDTRRTLYKLQSYVHGAGNQVDLLTADIFEEYAANKRRSSKTAGVGELIREATELPKFKESIMEPFAVQAVVARFGLTTVARVSSENQSRTFDEFFNERLHYLTFDGLQFLLTQSSDYALKYTSQFDDRFVVCITISRMIHSSVYALSVTISDRVRLVTKDRLIVESSYYKQQKFEAGELKQGLAFLESAVQHDAIKSAVDDAFTQIEQRRRNRRVLTKQSKSWPEAVQINGVLLRRVKASRDYSHGDSATSIEDKTLTLRVRSIFSVKYESARVAQDGRKIHSFQLHVSPETGEFVVGVRGPRTNTVSSRDGKVRHGTVGSPADLQKILDVTAKFLLPYMQKRNITSQKQPSASIINMRGADV